MFPIMKQRLSKTLAEAGVASRRECEKILAKGRVRVNGEISLLPQHKVDPAKDEIELDGNRLKLESKLYFLLNKPLGYLCTDVRIKGGAKIVLDLFSHIQSRLFTVGRLDQETDGLILITNDGEFANRVIHPSFCVKKEYLVKTAQEITADHLKTISSGTKVQGQWIRPLSVEKVRRGTLKIIVGEGKKHEIRHLVATAGLTLKSLTRIRIGPLLLGSLLPGEYRELTEEERSFF
ncbi:MAG: Ribosomal large subunit pseudouridine synthase B [Chlamydiae bacterium]|nr:Ribosomal large subunit pseudouridine synthase B [Chlamydiota bacterium]